MRFLWVAVVGVLTLAWLPGHAGPLDPFAGSWQGAKGDGVNPSELSVRIEPTTGGFEIEWIELGSKRARKDTFHRTDRPNVYAAGRGGGWLFKLFGADEPGNPLKGQTLRWARTDDSALIVYRLDIHDDGGYDLDRYSWVAVDGELTFAFEQRTHEAPVTTATGRLARAGGAE